MQLDWYTKSKPATGEHSKEINYIYKQAYKLATAKALSGVEGVKYAQVGQKYK